MTVENPTMETYIRQLMDEFADMVVAKLAMQTPAEPEADELLTIEQCAEILNVTPRTVREYVSGPDPWLPSVKVGAGARRVWRSKLMAKITTED